MEISLSKLKIVIDDLQDAELSYKRQVQAFESVLHGYKALDKNGNDKRALANIAEKMQREYQQLKKLRMTLTEIVRCYELTEKNIIGSAQGSFGGTSGVREIDIGDVKKILSDFNITLV